MKEYGPISNEFARDSNKWSFYNILCSVGSGVYPRGYFIGTFGCENLLYIMVIFVSGMIYEGRLKQLKNKLIFMIVI